MLRAAFPAEMLRAAFPADGRTLRRWIRDPDADVRALSLWTLSFSVIIFSGQKRG